MKHFFSSFLLVLSLLMGAVLPVQAQYQLPDPSFEDWSGAQFSGSIQPKYWNFSNVSQLGIANFNFAQQETGRNGGYAMKVQDQDLEVMGIGETSPGYIALGHPWAHVSSITAINKATAGTYGGISWTARPDTMAVWIKRTGPRWQDENYNILFYSWTGTSEGGSFKGKDGSCSSVPDTYRFDEESDIRIALDKNECSIITAGNQVAEGWIYEKATYANWTLIKIPIYYLNSQVPEKCNVIFSASNYPNFRANSGLYAGNTLIVDDVQLIYSSSIQKLFVGGKEWKGFDPNNTGIQTYSLGRGATTIPALEAYRGVGKITNVKGTTATFPGRKLSASECVINTAGASVDGAPVTLTVTAEDGSSTKTYRIQFVSQQSSNAYLSSIQLGDEPLSGFNAYVNNYNVSLPYGSTTVPTVSAEAQDGAAITITQATSVNGTATIRTVAQDGVSTQTYTIHFSVAQLSDNTLRNILIDGLPLPGFVSTKTSYNVSLPLGTTAAPQVTPVSAYPAGAQTITVLKNSLDEGCQISVTAPGTQVVRTYKLTYKIEASSYASLAGIALDGTPLEGFDPATTTYNIVLPMGTTTLPAITWTTGDAYQTVTMQEGGVDGTTRIVVTAAAGNAQTYRLNFSTEKSSNSRLAGIMLNGEMLEGFDSDILDYDITLPSGTKQLPAISWITGDDYQTVRLMTSGLTTPVRIIVTAGDGSVSTYVLTFTVEKSESALLQNILLDGVALEGFRSEVLDYRYEISTLAPHISVVKGDGQMVTISQPQGTGVACITVQPEVGAPNIYTITFFDENEVVIPTPVTPTYIPSQNADLSMIFLGGDSLPGFDPAQTEYTVVLPKGTIEQPHLTAVTADDKVACVVYTQGEVNAHASIHVVAEDTSVVRDYLINFPIAVSSNTDLEDIDAGGFLTFTPSQHEYSFEVPFGTPFPELYVTRADESQQVDMSYLDCRTRRDVEIVVAAETGAQAVYAVHMVVPSHPDNVLRSVIGEGWVLDSLTLNSADTLQVQVPYGSDFVLTGVVKNYDDQYVLINEGSLLSPTTIWVYSGRSGESPRVYTLMPKQDNPFLLTDLAVDGVSLPGFAPDRFDYVFSAGSSAPVITASVADGAELEVVSEDVMSWTAHVLKDGVEGPLYTIWFHYPLDVTFSQDFEDWASVSTTLADVDMGVPVGWHTPVDATTTGDKGSYDPKSSFSASDDATDGSHSAALKTAYLLTSAEAMPGVLSLSEQSVSIGAYYIVGHTPSTLSFGNGITFRNTPDSVALDYKMLANNKVNAWHFKWMTNGQVMFDYTGSYDTKNEWLTVGQRLNYAADYVPSLLDIHINPAQSETLSDYYVGTNGAQTRNRFTSSMLVDHLQIIYDSELKGIVFGGETIAPDASHHFEITLPTEFVGVPEFGFVKSVHDQAPAVSWSKEVHGVRTAVIRNYAEDGSYTDYTLTATRPLSEDAGFTQVGAPVPAAGRHAAQGVSLGNLHFRLHSEHATAQVQMLADSMVVTVTAESGATSRTAFLAFVHDTVRSEIPAVITPVGHDSTMVDSIPTVYSSNLDLACILLGDDTLKTYSPFTESYTIYLPTSVVVTGVPGDEQQTITPESYTPLNDGSDLYYIHVRAGNGDTRVYSVRVLHALPSSDASLIDVLLDGVSLPEFVPTTYHYAVNLPAHSVLPDIEAVPAEGHAMVSMSRSGNSISLLVKAEDGIATQTYTFDFTILPSDWSSLTGILVAGEPLEDFEPTTYNYEVTLPVGTTTMPTIGYSLLEPVETVTIDTVSLANYEGQYVLHVTAEDGVHRSDYTVHFTVAKSSDATLSSLSVDGVELPGFDPEQLTYQVTLPYGYMCVPEVRFTVSDTTATALLTHSDLDSAKVTVTAEDEVTVLVYRIDFTVAKSSNDLLRMIYVDGDSLAGFDAETFEYTLTLPYGVTEHPVLTWEAGDEQQTVLLKTGVADTIYVEAGNGSSNEYVISYLNELSSNNYLSDLQLQGVTVTGFHRDSTEFTLIYPVGTTDSELFHKEDVVAVPEDPTASWVANEDDSHTLSVIVTAANGDVRPYVVRQIVLLSEEARLQMIYLDSVAMSDFDPDVLEYTVIIPQGATAPEVTAETIDPLAEVEYGMITDEEGGQYIEIDGVAEDGTRITYTVHFREATWSPMPDVSVDDYLFIYMGDGLYKAVTIGLNVSVNIYDTNGHRVAYGDVPTADPNDVTVEIREDGSRKLVAADPDADGFEFYVSHSNTVYFYTFFDVRNKRVAKGGKFCVVR